MGAQLNKRVVKEGGIKCKEYYLKNFQIGVFSGPYFPVFSRNTKKYRPEKTPYWDTIDAVEAFLCKSVCMGYVQEI